VTWDSIRCVFKNNLFSFNIIGDPALFIHTPFQESKIQNEQGSMQKMVNTVEMKWMWNWLLINVIFIWSEL
jgi:hypothetical protein